MERQYNYEEGKKKMKKKCKKKLLLVFVQVKFGVKKVVLVRATIFAKQIFLTKNSKKRKEKKVLVCKNVKFCQFS